MIAKNLSIIGLGRLGASIALAVKSSSLDVELIGYEEDQKIAQEVKTRNIVNKIETDVRKLAEHADILILAVSYKELKRIMPVIGDVLQEHCLVLDFTDLKGPALKLAQQYMTNGHYIGASPVFAADWLVDGRSELALASGDMFKKSVFCLMPSAKADPEAVETAVNFGYRIGSVPFFVDAMEYDSLQIGIKTVPGLLAAALFSSVSKSTGWRDMLRFASVPFAMSTQPLAESTDLAHEVYTNKIATMRYLDSLIHELTTLRQKVHESEEEILAATIEGFAVEREVWLRDRQKNDWAEGVDSDFDPGLGTSHFLGAFGHKRKRKDEG